MKRKMRVLKATIVLILTLVMLSPLRSQNTLGQNENNMLRFGVPFLLIAPDARGSAMGDAGVSSEPDVYSMYYNPAKYAFAPGETGIGISYTPWLKNTATDIYFASAHYFRHFGNGQTFATSLRYLKIGNVPFTDDNGASLGTYNPNEFAIDVAYARKLSDNLSMAIAWRYIRSDLSQGQFLGGVQSKAGNSIAADIALYWKKKIYFSKLDGTFALGVNVSNIGAKISYGDNNDEFLPTNLRFGPSLTLELDHYNRISFLIDVNKLLIPTPPEYDQEGNIIRGKNPNVSVVPGIFQSFWDAPGGFGEELSEFTLGFGTEYWYHDQFTIRVGYFHESARKGNRKFFTTGVGVRFNDFGMDLSYLLPFEKDHPLANTLRFSLLWNMGTWSN